MLQIDKTASAVTLEVGIADLAHHSRIWETAPKDVIATPYCFARSRLGEVVTGGDRWTPVEDPEAPALLASEAATRLPDFFDGLHSEAQLDAFLDQRHGRNGRHTYPPVVMYRALLKVSLGHPDLGCALLRKISTRQSAWSESVERLSRELGCVP